MSAATAIDDTLTVAQGAWHDPISHADFSMMSAVAAGFQRRFGTSAEVIDDLQHLRRPHTAPGEFLTGHSTGTSGTHWVLTRPRRQVPVKRLDLDALAHRQAALFTGTVWAATRAAGGPAPDSHTRLYPRAFDPAWLADLPIPTARDRPAGLPTALVAGAGMDWPGGAAQVAEAYARQPRTLLFESLQVFYGWANLVSRWTGALSASSLTVAIDVFDSRHGDLSPDVHWDACYAIVVQVDGAKTWQLGPGVQTPGANLLEATLRAGDVLVVPPGVLHRVATPADPGHFRHLVLAVRRLVRQEDEPTAVTQHAITTAGADVVADGCIPA